MENNRYTLEDFSMDLNETLRKNRCMKDQIIDMELEIAKYRAYAMDHDMDLYNLITDCQCANMYKHDKTTLMDLFLDEKISKEDYQKYKYDGRAYE